jgi:hypothetical protein
LTAVRDKKWTKLDEGAIQRIIGEFEDEADHTTPSAAAANKAKHRVQARLALEKKLAQKKGRHDDDDDEDENDIGDLTAVAKPSSKKKS